MDKKEPVYIEANTLIEYVNHQLELTCKLQKEAEEKNCIYSSSFFNGRKDALDSVMSQLNFELRMKELFTKNIEQ